MIYLPSTGENLRREPVAGELQYVRLLRFLGARLPNEQDAQELAQEAYLRMLRVSDANLIRDPAAYLFRIARGLLQEWYASLPPPRDSLDDVELADEGRTVEDQANIAQNMDRLEKALRRLSPKCRAVVLMHRRDGMTLRRDRRRPGHFVVHGEKAPVQRFGALPREFAQVLRVLRDERAKNFKKQ